MVHHSHDLAKESLKLLLHFCKYSYSFLSVGISSTLKYMSVTDLFFSNQTRSLQIGLIHNRINRVDSHMIVNSHTTLLTFGVGYTLHCTLTDVSRYLSSFFSSQNMYLLRIDRRVMYMLFANEIFVK